MYKLSFCIPTYNNTNAINKLVQQLLSNKNERFQVVVSDNHSSDDTIASLSKIDDPRLKLHVNDENIGAQLNWNKALEEGDGEFLYLVMGRDRLNPSKIDRLLSFLDRWGDESDCFYDRPTPGNDFVRYQGIESYLFFINCGHPTGIIFKRERYLCIVNRERFFSLGYTYPENYIKDRMLRSRNHTCGVLPAGVFINQVNIDKKKVKSNFENPTKTPFFFPQRRISQVVLMINIVLRDGDHPLSKKEKMFFLEKKYKYLLMLVTSYWKKDCADPVWMSHYCLATRNVNAFEQIKNISAVLKSLLRYYSQTLSGFEKAKLIMYSLGKTIDVLLNRDYLINVNQTIH